MSRLFEFETVQVNDDHRPILIVHVAMKIPFPQIEALEARFGVVLERVCPDEEKRASVVFVTGPPR